MRSRLTSAFVITLGVSLVFTACGGKKSVSAAPTALHVQASATGDATDLRDAVARIADGGTITLGPGTYDLDKLLTINKSVQLVGAGVRQTRIVSTVKGKGVLFTGSHHFSVSGITFSHEGTAPGGAVWVNAGSVHFSNCRFTGAASNRRNYYYEALWLRGTASGVVENCTADESDVGIGVAGKATPVIQGCVCTSNSYAGMAIYGNGRPSLRHDRCSGNDQFGIVASAHAHLMIQSCQCNSGTTGIQIGGKVAGSISFCTCNGNSTHGVLILGSARVAVDKSTCNSDGDFGIAVAGTAKATVTNNQCLHDKGAGIGFGGTARGTASGNTCNRDGSGASGGLCVTEHANVTVTGNQCDDNASYGILFRDHARGVARDNECSGNDYGIIINSPATAKLVGNTLDWNKTQAIGRW